MTPSVYTDMQALFAADRWMALVVVLLMFGIVWGFYQVINGCLGYASARIVRKPATVVPLRPVRSWHLPAHKGLTSQQEARDRQVFEAVTRIGGRR